MADEIRKKCDCCGDATDDTMLLQSVPGVSDFRVCRACIAYSEDRSGVPHREAEDCRDEVPENNEGAE